VSGFALSPAAQADIADIWDYTAGRWGEAQAERYVLGVRDACQRLAAGSMASRAADDIRAGYRKAVVGSHVLFFRVGDGGVLTVIRVLHQRMDVAGHL
jgi:toxin ParE1/3/4